MFDIFKRKQKPYHITIPINNFQKNKKLANKIIFSKHLSKIFKYIKYQAKYKRKFYPNSLSIKQILFKKFLIYNIYSRVIK